MKIHKLLIIFILGCMAGKAFAALSVVSVKTLDSAGANRTYFSSTEKISFAIVINNSAASSGRISYSFAVKDPSGRTVLTQTGNSAPGSAGQSGSEIRNISVEKFFSFPGFYTLETSASLDGSSVSSNQRFQVSSPVITLSYPPNGSRGLPVNPLIFRWAGSGASQYKIYVGDHQSLSLNVFTEMVHTTSFTYPENPTNEQHKLVSDQKYYWKVEGIGTSGNVIAEASGPFSFTVKSQTSRDVAITGITIGKNPLGPGFVPIIIHVKNQGSTPEGDITIDLFINGLPVKKSKEINRIEAGRLKKVVFPVRLPEITDKVLVVASHGLFDDNMRNNRFSKIFNEEELIKDKKIAQERMDLAELWGKLKRALNRPNLVSKFEDYTLYAIEPDTDETRAMIKKIIEGKAKVTKTKIKIQR